MNPNQEDEQLIEMGNDKKIRVIFKPPFIYGTDLVGNMKMYIMEHLLQDPPRTGAIPEIKYVEIPRGFIKKKLEESGIAFKPIIPVIEKTKTWENSQNSNNTAPTQPPQAAKVEPKVEPQTKPIVILPESMVNDVYEPRLPAHMDLSDVQNISNYYIAKMEQLLALQRRMVAEHNFCVQTKIYYDSRLINVSIANLLGLNQEILKLRDLLFKRNIYYTNLM